MCGISGILSYSKHSESELRSVVRKMGAFQYHRGPDAWGDHVLYPIAFGHNRLSILDIEFGQQPMTTRDGRYTIVFNGEIYNHLVIRNELIARGYVFSTDHSDTETILIGYQHSQSDIFEKLEGMFAIAIWDHEERELVIARDRFGIKPFYYADVPGVGIVFSSEVKGLIGSGLLSRKLNEDAVVEYFHFRSPVHPNTLLHGVSKVRPGTYLKVRGNSRTIDEIYFAKISELQIGQSLSRAGYLSKLDWLLEESVQSQLMADVPIGIFLSGGVDSSVIAAMVKRSRNIIAFNLGTKSIYDESPFAQLVAEKLDLPLKTLFLDDNDFIKQVNDWVYFNDDPVSDPSALALMLLAEEVEKEGVKVMLSGEGADELFHGYYSYLKYTILKRIATVIPQKFLKIFLARTGQAKLIDYLEFPSSPFLGTAHLTAHSDKLNLFRSEHHIRIERFYANMKNRFSASVFDGEKGPLLIDQITRLPADLLSRTDRATMAHSIEARVPFLNSALAEFANSVPNSQLVHVLKLRGKDLLKELASTMLPPSVIYRRKRGFDLPVHNWLNQSFQEKIKLFISERKIDMINYEFLKTVCSKPIRAKESGWLWAWIILEYWYRNWMEGEPRPRIQQEHLDHYFATSVTRSLNV